MTEKERFLSNLCVICDTREQKNEHITKVFDKLHIPHIKQQLPYGDYSFICGCYNFNLLYSVERKANINELWGNITKERTRFEAEINRMKQISGSATLIIENCPSLEYMKHYRISPAQMEREKRKVSDIGLPIYNTLQAWSSPNRYNLQVRCIDHNSDTAGVLLGLFYNYWHNFQTLIKPQKNYK